MQIIKKIQTNLHLLFVIARIERQLRKRGLTAEQIELLWADAANLCDDVGNLTVSNLIDTVNRIEKTFF
jgi:hypothetical protein